jgi:two-component system, NtrC family, sensor kinase
MEDTIERRRAEKKLRESSELIWDLVDSIPEAVYGIDLDGLCTFCNPACLELLGYEDRADLLGKNMHDLIHHTREDGTHYPVEECHIFEAFRRGHGTHIDNEVLWRRDGTRFFAEYWSRPMRRGEQVVGTVVTFVDITQRKLTQQALRESERRYRLLFERNMAGVFRTTLEGRVLECNPAAARLFGCDSPEEVLSLPITTFYHTASDREALLTRLKSETSLTNYEMRFQRKNGDPAWTMLNLSLVDDDSGTGKIIEGTFVDITKRKQAEAELHESRRMLQCVLDAIPQRVFWKDRKSTYVFCNKALAHDAGLDNPAAVVGKNDFDLAWKASAESYRADDKLVMEQGSAKFNFEERQSRPDGSLRWLQTTKLPLRDQDGNITGVLGTYEDITERKRAEMELRLTQFSLEQASYAVEWINSQARIVYVNRAECLALERTREEILSLSIPDIDPLFHMEKWGEFWQDLKTQGTMNFESQHQTKSGRIFPVEVTANYLEFDGQEYCFAFVRDVTERRALESQLRQAQKLEGIGQLAAGIAHEINTPTQFVTDNLGFLRESWNSTKELLDLYRNTIQNHTRASPQDLANTISQAERTCDLDFIIAEVPRAIEQSLDGAHRVAEIVRAMKTFSHQDSVDKTATDLNNAIASTITVARSEWKYVADVVTDLDDTLPLIICHPGDINQVILNLLVNAAHAIKEKIGGDTKGRIDVRTRRCDNFVEISIADTGTGISEDIRSKVFDPFFTTKEIGEGTGQGLAIAYALIVKKHFGRLWFETETGVGTTFFISIPIDPLKP